MDRRRQRARCLELGQERRLHALEGVRRRGLAQHHAHFDAEVVVEHLELAHVGHGGERLPDAHRMDAHPPAAVRGQLDRVRRPALNPGQAPPWAPRRVGPAGGRDHVR